MNSLVKVTILLVLSLPESTFVILMFCSSMPFALFYMSTQEYELSMFFLGN